MGDNDDVMEIISKLERCFRLLENNGLLTLLMEKLSLPSKVGNVLDEIKMSMNQVPIGNSLSIKMRPSCAVCFS
jgi:hypothetical protein